MTDKSFTREAYTNISLTFVIKHLHYKMYNGEVNSYPEGI